MGMHSGACTTCIPKSRYCSTRLSQNSTALQAVHVRAYTTHYKPHCACYCTAVNVPDYMRRSTKFVIATKSKRHSTPRYIQQYTPQERNTTIHSGAYPLSYLLLLHHHQLNTSYLWHRVKQSDTTCPTNTI